MEAKDVGKRIKTLREKRHLSKNALANNAGVSPTYIYQLEEGMKSPTVEYLDHICWGLGISLNDFFSDDDSIQIEDKVAKLTDTQKQLLNDFLNSL